MAETTYRLVTRSDFDGLVCAVLLQELGIIDDIKFVHPKDMQDGKVDITDRDITCNLPYVETAHLVFDHHASEVERLGGARANQIIDASAPSAARVVYRHYGGEPAFPRVSVEMMQAVDQADSAQFRKSDILAPQGWTLLNFIMDARTGLGRFRDFRVSNYQLMMELIKYCRSHSIEEILELPDVRERVDLYRDHEPKFIEQLDRCSHMHGTVVVVDLRDEATIFAGNRFMIYALHPSALVSMHVMWGLKQRNTVFAVGRSIVNRNSAVNIGALMLEFGGGGHEAAGTCQIDNDQVGTVRDELLARLDETGTLAAERLPFG